MFCRVAYWFMALAVPEAAAHSKEWTPKITSFAIKRQAIDMSPGTEDKATMCHAEALSFLINPRRRKQTIARDEYINVISIYRRSQSGVNIFRSTMQSKHSGNGTS